MWGSTTFRSPTTSSSGTNSSGPNQSDSSMKDNSRAVEIRVRNLDAEHSTVSPNTSTKSMGWLLRLFQSEFFDAFMAVTYLYRYRHTRGVHDYLCNQLYQLSDADLEAFMPQLCNLLVHHSKHSEALERFVMDKCAVSMHIALQVFWFLQAAVEDAAGHSDKTAETRCKILRTRCETAAVNGSSSIMLRAAADPSMSAATVIIEDAPFSPPHPRPTNATLFPSSSAGAISLTPSSNCRSKNAKETDRRKEQTLIKPIFRTGSSGIAVVDGIDSDDDHEKVEEKAEISKMEQEVKHDGGANGTNTNDDKTNMIPQKTHCDQKSANSKISETKPNCSIDGNDVPGDIKADDHFVDANDHIKTDETSSNSTMNTDNTTRIFSDTVRITKEVETISLNQSVTDPTKFPNDQESNENTSREASEPESNLKDVGSSDQQIQQNDNSSTFVQSPAPSTPASEEFNLPSSASHDTENSRKEIDSDAITKNSPDSMHTPNSNFKASENDIHDYDPATLLTMKQERFEYFNDSVTIAKAFANLSMTTKDLPQDQRQAHLTKGLEKINDILLRRMKGEPGIPLIEGTPVPSVTDIAKRGMSAALKSVHLALTRASSQALRILRVHSDEVVILTSRTRAPYKVNIEVLPTEMTCSDKLLFCEHRINKADEVSGVTSAADSSKRGKKLGSFPNINVLNEKARQGETKTTTKGLISPPGAPPPTLKMRKLSEMTPAERQRANVRNRVYGDAYSEQPDLFQKAEEEANAEEVDENTAEFKARQAVILSIYGELWSWKEERILKGSPFRNLKGTKLLPFIVKAGDDLRQEQLAIQLIRQFQSIFKEERVDVFLKPFTMMSISSEAGFVEVISDAVSVHSLKKRTPNFVSLLDYFEKAFGEVGTPSFRAAQRRFIRSMAGYSLVTYFLQIKDRHNGNIMIDVYGQIIHIDFGFMLTNSPGAIKFESVPFKLTEEYLQVMCGKKNVLDLAEASKTEGYRYFQELFVLGLLAARKHYEKITTLVEIMSEGTTMPCMTAGHSVVESLCSRFAVGMPEEECINFALGLIEESRLSWRSAGYDRFQAYSNGYR